MNKPLTATGLLMEGHYPTRESNSSGGSILPSVQTSPSNLRRLVCSRGLAIGHLFFDSLPIFFAISAINLGFRSARTLSTMFEISLDSSPVAAESILLRFWLRCTTALFELHDRVGDL